MTGSDGVCGSATGRRPTVVLAMRPDLPDRLLTGPARERLAALADVDTWAALDTFTCPAAARLLGGADVLLTGWGCPRIDADVLARAPRLRAIVHAAGSVKGHVDPGCWEHGLVVSTAADANAVPVAEFTVAMVLLAGKSVPRLEGTYRAGRAHIDLVTTATAIGNYRRRVGVVGASRIGRRVLRLLRAYDLDLACSDPYLTAAGATELGVPALELDELVARSDVLSLHAPAVPATRHMIDRRRLALLPDGATLINTARGSLVDEDALVDELTAGRLSAVLDVTGADAGPLPPDSPLWDLPNVVLTPHVAGAAGNELLRLGDWAVEEIGRFAAGEPFLGPVLAADLDRMA